jgi:hypothetical protein
MISLLRKNIQTELETDCHVGFLSQQQALPAITISLSGTEHKHVLDRPSGWRNWELETTIFSTDFFEVEEIVGNFLASYSGQLINDNFYLTINNIVDENYPAIDGSDSLIYSTVITWNCHYFQIRTFDFESKNHLVGGGSSEIQANFELISEGGISSEGLAEVFANYSLESTGGAVLNGISNATDNFELVGSGGLSVAGTANETLLSDLLIWYGEFLNWYDEVLSFGP